jgi:peptide/nickel transport system substrate-binding protein
VVLPALPRDADPARAESQADRFLASATAGALLERDAAGELVPGILAEVPRPEDGGTTFRLRLKPGLRLPGGGAFTATDLARSIARLLSPGAGNAWAALPIAGADAVLAGRAAAPSGLRALSETELLVSLAFPLPELPELLAATPLAVSGLGPFVLPPALPAAGALRLAASADHPRGRPFADALELAAADARRAGRLLETGEAHLVLRPEPHGKSSRPWEPDRVVTIAALAAERLGAAADGVRRVLAALDRSELARRFVRGPSRPLVRLVPDGEGDPPPPRPPRPPEEVALSRPLRFLVRASAPDQRALAGRVQVKLFDRGVRAIVEAVDDARFAERLARRDYDVALVPVPLAVPSPALAAGQLAFAARGPAAARSAMAALAGLGRREALVRAEGLARELDLVPLVETGLHASSASALEPAAPGDLWLTGGGAFVP